MRSDLDIGIFRDLQERGRRLEASRRVRHSEPPLRIDPLVDMAAERRIVPPARFHIILRTVARLADLSVEAIVGDSRAHRLVNARYCAAVLAVEFAPKMTARSIDIVMKRGDGLCLYYRYRHVDRGMLFPEYLDLYLRCHKELTWNWPK